MIKLIITDVVTIVAGAVGYFLSPAFRERQAQKQRDKIASEVARGDEAAVNARAKSTRMQQRRWSGSSRGRS